MRAGTSVRTSMRMEGGGPTPEMRICSSSDFVQIGCSSGIDVYDTAEVLTDEFCASPAVERSIHCASSARLGAAGMDGNEC